MSRILYLQRLDVSSAFPDHAMEDGVVVSYDAVRLSTIAKRFVEVTRVSTRYLKFASGIRAQITDDHFVLEIPLHLRDSIGRNCILLVLSDQYPTFNDATQLGQEVTSDILDFLCSLDELTIYPPENHEVLTQKVIAALEKIASANEVPRQENCERHQTTGKSRTNNSSGTFRKSLRGLVTKMKQMLASTPHSQSESNPLEGYKPTPEE